MSPAFVFFSLLLGWSCFFVTAGSAEQCRDASVSAFSAAFYAAMVLSNDPNVVFVAKLPTEEGAALLHDVLLAKLRDFAVCNAARVANTVAKAAGFLPEFNLPDYFLKKGFTIGDYLVQEKILNCENAVHLAISYHTIVQGLLDGLDGTRVESYMQAISGGLLTWLEQLEFSLPAAANDLAFIFYDELSKA